MSAAAMALPPLSIRGDLGVISTAATRYAPSLLKSFIQMGPQGALSATKLLRPFSEIMDSLDLKDPFIRNWVDLLAFLLAGVKSNGILSAEMVTSTTIIDTLSIYSPLFCFEFCNITCANRVDFFAYTIAEQHTCTPTYIYIYIYI